MIDTLCFGSGGLKGISYITCLKYLEKNNYIDLKNINKYTGVSVGSIISLLFIVGFTTDELINLLFKKIDFTRLKPEINLDLIFEEYGFDTGTKLIDYIKEIVFKKLNYNKDDISLLELFNLTSKELYICATNLTKKCQKIFNYKDTPNVSIFLVIRMSISIPIIFSPVFFENEYYIDGAFTNKVYFENCNPKTTLIFNIEPHVLEITSIIDILYSSILLLVDNLYKENISNYKLIDIINTAINYNSETTVTKKNLKILFLNGNISGKKFFKKELKLKIKSIKKNIIKHIMDEMIDKITMI